MAIPLGMRNKVRALVSADRERFQDGRFDLDLSYITPNIIAMAIPSSGLSTGMSSFPRHIRSYLSSSSSSSLTFFFLAWRNSVDEVVAMLEYYHADAYMIFNLR